MIATLRNYYFQFTSPQKLQVAITLGGFTLAALAVAVITATGNLVMTGLIIGAVLGVLMLDAAAAVIWIILIGGLLVTGPIVLFQPQYARIGWIFSILGIFLIFAAVAHVARRDTYQLRRNPPFVFYMIFFAVFGVVVSIFAGGGLNEGAAGIRRYHQFLGVMLAMALVPIKPESIKSWLRFLVLLGLIQVPFALYQRLVLVPERMNLPRGVVPVDVVAGTFEAYMYGGGNSNVMALFILVLLAGILSCYREGVVSPWRTLLLAGTIAIPLTLGETKMVLILLPAMMYAVYVDLVRTRPVLFLIGVIFTVLMLMALVYLYVMIQTTDGRPMTFEARLRMNMEYNIGNRGYGDETSLNRSNVVQFWWSKHGPNYPVSALVGHGLGASFWAPDNNAAGHIGLRYPGFLIDLTSVSTLLWDVGIIGLLLYFGVLVSAWFCCRKLIARASPGLDRAICRTLSASVAMMLVFAIASNAAMVAASMQVLLMFTLGLIAWRWRQPTDDTLR